MSRFQGTTDFDHRRVPHTGILLTNLGTPDAPTPSALRRYLGEFLWDPRVVEIPRPIWWLILNGIILNTRPRKSAHAYQSVWMEQGSPLLVYSEAQTKEIRERLQRRASGPVTVELAMRYGNPSITAGLRKLQQAGAERLLVLPLYPQYSGATTGSTFDAVAAELRTWRWVPELRMINHYHDFPPYIEAMAGHIEDYWSREGRNGLLLFSYHGLPRRNLLLGDPYHCQCHATSRLLSERLGLSSEEWMTTFQSRFGKAEWLKPYTDVTLKSLPSQGKKQVDVFCPGFSVDCLETIEEIGVENRDYFLAAGGERYRYIPALNAIDSHIDALVELILQHTRGWPEFSDELTPEENRAAAQLRFERAETMKKIS
jgi:ferrochelatase